MKILLTIILFCLCNFHVVYACRCTPSSNFCSTIMTREGEVSSRVSVVRVIVEKKAHQELIVKMTDFLGGLFPANNTIRIQGGNGGNCLLEIDCFHVGDELILAAEYSKAYDTYSLTLCGVPFLMVKDEMVSGKIAGELTEIAYHKLGDVISCRLLNTTRLKDRVRIFPNITADVVNITIGPQNLSPVTVAWDVVSLDGKIIQTSQMKEYYPNERIPIDLGDKPQGIYFLRIRNPGEDLVTYKLFKEN